MTADPKTLTPSDDLLADLIPNDPLMSGASVSCLCYCVRNPEMLDQFKADTGITWPVAKNRLEEMIDEATGANRHYIRSFAEWFNANIWEGEPDDE